MGSFKDDKGKLDYSLVPEEWERGIALVMAHGANKYGANTWQKVDNAKRRYYSALRRHLAEWWHFIMTDGKAGSLCDKESNIPHLFHVAVNALMLEYFTKKDVLEGGVVRECPRHNPPKQDVPEEVTVNLDELREKVCEEYDRLMSKVSKHKDNRKVVKIKVADEETAEKIASVLEEMFNG